ncbi:endolytic transglycosylase MltG [Candidatus Collierbacteria bacterium]|nr:endolytic transglycosylase MltG [Candidatus Collierbacteria bacterium]
MFKKIFLPALIGTLLIGWYISNIGPVSKSKNLQIFVIPKGQPTRTILKRLQAEGIIRSSLAAEIYLFLTKQRGLFQAGSFRLNPAMSIFEVASALKTGTLDVWITIPEGWRAEQITDELKNQGFLENSNLNELYQLFRQSEGRLFPDTYLFAKGSAAEKIIEKMTDNFDAKISSLTSEDISAKGRSASGGNPLTHEIITLASLVEREARHDTDRPLVAGVLKNRLKIGMALQVDATLQYAKASITNNQQPITNNQFNWWPQITSADKSINSTYNTYKYPGLPPGPIANPGIEALEATLNPTKTDYLYYVSEPDGTTHYAKTLEEHNANVTKYLQ